MDVEVVCESGECLYQGYEGLEEARTVYSEELQNITEGKTKSPVNCLKVQLPVGFVDKETANGNLYEMKEMNKSLEHATPLMGQGLIQGASGAHPKDRADLRPDEISHLITKAWVDPKSKLIWNEWLIIPTQKGGGADLATLFLAGASIGASIRGTAVREGGKYMRHYTFKGTDTVAIPSTGIRPGVNNENLRAKIMVESFSKTQEVMEGVMAMGGELADEVRNVSETLKGIGSESKGGGTDLIALGAKLGSLEAKVAVMESTGDKKEVELDNMKQRVEEFKNVKETLEREKNAAVRESATFQATINDLREQVETFEADLNKKSTSLSTAIQALEELRDRYQELESGKGDVDKSVAVIEDLRDYALACEDILGGAKEYILGLEGVVEEVRDYALALESTIEDLVERHDDKVFESDSLVHIVAELRDRIKGIEVKKSGSVSMEAFVKHTLNQYPQLKIFTEELRNATTVAGVNGRVKKYLDLLDKSASAKFVKEQSEDKETPAARGIERHLGGLK